MNEAKRPTEIAPSDHTAEAAMLGSILLDNLCLAGVANIVGPEDLQHPRHRAIFKAMVDLDAERKPIDTISLRHKMGEELHRLGGLAAIAQLAETVPTAANAEHYARIVRDAAVRRGILLAAGEIRAAAQQNTSGDEAYAQAQAALGRAQGGSTGKPMPISKLVAAEYRRMEEAANSGVKRIGLPTGFPSVDTVTGGLHDGEFILVGGRPSMGKTSIGLQFADAVASRRGPALFCSLEMPRDTLTQKWLSLRSGVALQRIRSAELSPSDWELLARAASETDSIPLVIDDEEDYPLPRLRNRIRKAVRSEGVKAVFVDYLQLITVPGADDRFDGIRKSSKLLKLLARELSVPIVALCQLNRDVEKRRDKRPIPSDLEGAGALEQDADLILFPFRPSQYDSKKDVKEAELIIAKQRNGPVGTAYLDWQPWCSRFVDPQGDLFHR